MFNSGFGRMPAGKYSPMGVVLLLAASVGPTFGADRVSIEASRQGTAVAIVANATVRAPYALVWQTSTDYDHLSEFIPGMVKSHVIGRRGGAVTVEQTGKAGFLFFTYPIDVVVESLEAPPAFVGIRILKGNLKQLYGGYRIEKTGDNDDEFSLRWSGVIEPSISLPLFITVPLMRAAISDQFRGMVREIERRESLRAAKEASK